MSALAARRAAALLASQNPTSSFSKAPSPQPSVASSPSPQILESDSDEDGSTPPPPPPATNKKRKLRKSSPPPAITPPTRYHNDTFPTTMILKPEIVKSNRKRRFSPSAPAEEPDVVSEDGSDTSVGDSDADLAEEGMNDVDEGRAQWSVPITSVDSTPGPSRNKPKPVIQDSTGVDNTSKFAALENVNIYKVSKDDLRLAGLKDDYAGDGMIISLAKEETLIIAGTYTLTLLSGSISISSCTLQCDGTSYPVFAPISHPIPVISPVSAKKNQSVVPWLSQLKLPKGFRKAQTLFLIRENNCGIDGLRYGAVPGFAHIWLEEIGSWGLKGVHPVIGSFSTPIYPHTTPPTWSEALSSLSSNDEASERPIVGLIKGPKRSGKSTFGRAVLNNLLEKYERVAWLECDLGQGEFSAGGIVGLWVLDKQVFGPSFTHPSVSYRAHYLGTYTPLTCPDKYITSLKHLLEIYKFDIQHSLSASTSTFTNKINDQVPLVVNTQGWVKGLGEELLQSIEGMSEPTHIYSFSSPYEEEQQYTSTNGWTNSPVYPTSLLPDPYSDEKVQIKQIILESAPITPLQARFSAADLRVLSILSYFYSSISPEGIKKWDFAKPLTYLNPWEVEYGTDTKNKAINRIYMIGEGSEGVLSEDLNIALNGSIVALIEFINTVSMIEDGDEDQVYLQGRSLPELDSMNFLGLGLIRYIQPSSLTLLDGKIHLLTPLSAEVLGRCKGLIKNGAIELPTPGMLGWSKSNSNSSTQGEGEEGQIPFFDKSGIEVVGGERRRWRKNIMRKGM
ncbi:hypothetical protein L486_05961 [Kwoniella mangroviensis CBS 10435]|uniref:Polynucleotide 5'-hydroxyl-kinase GRC3 n=1 Tax=Kwoniella mangroviensis CBS 10435 TaxID=1331196 RepID=A0A1B9INF7_9TREE|nr:hypothetical protein L486_05961 [Kwoniella mangroviensis CBS 10435]